MQRAIPILAAVISMNALDAHAHTPLEGSSPANGTAVHEPVTEIVLEFGEGVRLTAVALADEAGTRKTLAAPPADVAARFVIDVRADLEPGDYTISWRGVGADTHIVSGEIQFTFTAAGPN
jgi:hypothetical protein